MAELLSLTDLLEVAKGNKNLFLMLRDLNVLGRNELMRMDRESQQRALVRVAGMYAGLNGAAATRFVNDLLSVDDYWVTEAGMAAAKRIDTFVELRRRKRQVRTN